MKTATRACYIITALFAAYSGVAIIPKFFGADNAMEQLVTLALALTLPAVWYILALSLDRLTGDQGG